MSCDFKFPQLVELQRFARTVPQMLQDSLPAEMVKWYPEVNQDQLFMLYPLVN